MHALTSPEAWKDYGRTCRINPKEEFTWLWGNMLRHQKETNQDRIACYEVFMQSYRDSRPHINTCPMCCYYTRPGFIINAWQIVPCFECNQDNKQNLPVPNEISETIEGQMREAR